MTAISLVLTMSAQFSRTLDSPTVDEHFLGPLLIDEECTRALFRLFRASF